MNFLVIRKKSILLRAEDVHSTLALLSSIPENDEPGCLRRIWVGSSSNYPVFGAVTLVLVNLRTGNLIVSIAKSRFPIFVLSVELVFC